MLKELERYKANFHQHTISEGGVSDNIVMTSSTYDSLDPSLFRYGIGNATTALSSSDLSQIAAPKIRYTERRGESIEGAGIEVDGCRKRAWLDADGNRPGGKDSHNSQAYQQSEYILD